MSLPPRRSAVAGLALTLAISVPFAASAPGADTTPVAVPAIVPAVDTAAVAKAAAQRKTEHFSQRVIDIAARYKGTPYVLGGTTPRGFDCSGFTRHVFAKLDKTLPRTAQQQFNRAQRVEHPRVGDLLFYHQGSKKGPVYHVVIYAGRDRVWHAPNPGTPVKKGKIYSKHWTAGRF